MALGKVFPVSVVIGGVDRLSPVLGKAGARLSRFGQRAERTGRRLSLGVTAPVVAFGVAAATTAVSFEGSMNRVRAITETTVEQVAGLRAEAKRLGATTAFTASETADAMAFLGQAGFQVGEIMLATEPVLNLASAANLEIARTADIASNILTGYGLEIERTGFLTDRLAKTTSSSNTDLEQLGEAMKLAGPVAAGFNQNLTTTLAIAGKLGDAGIQGTLAGTAIKNALVNIAKDAPAAVAVLRDLGIEPRQLRDSEGQLLQLHTILGMLEEQGATTEQLMRIFGLRAGPATATLVRQGFGAIDQLVAKLDDADGAAQRMATTMLEGAPGALKEMRSAFEGVQLAIAESGLLADLEELVREITGVLQAVIKTNPELIKSAAKWAGLAAAVGPALVTLGIAGASLGGIATGLGTLTSAIGIAVPALKALGVALFAGLGPIGWGILAVGALVAAGAVLMDHWDAVKAKAGQVWGWIKAQVKAVHDGFVELVRLIGDSLIPDFLGDPFARKDTLEQRGKAMQRRAQQLGLGEPISRRALDVTQPATAGRHESRVVVRLENAPPGTRVREMSGDVPLDVSLGIAMPHAGGI